MLCNTKFVVHFQILLCVLFHLVNANTIAGTGSDTKIYKGNSAIGHPYLKHVVIVRTRRTLCGGAIIKPTVIVTAAHCFPQNKTIFEIFMSKAYVCAGTPYFKCNGRTRQTARVKYIFVHEEYDSTGDTNDDIAIVTLKEPLFEDGKTVQRISIADRTPSIGTTCTTIGWGRTKCADDDIERPTEAQYTLLTIAAAENCHKSPHLYPNQLCVVDKNETSVPCQGDSGGPLICDGKVNGVLSLGLHSSQNRHYALYTDVFGYQKWINEILKEHYYKKPSGAASVRVAAVDFCITFVMALFSTVHYSFYF